MFFLFLMNIFYLDEDPKKASEYHNDKHVIKMILESSQLLSTAHRVLDGKETIEIKNNRKLKRWKLSDDRETILYKSTHINHPCAVWVRMSEHHYNWLYQLLLNLCKEYTFRYDKIHKIERELVQHLYKPPSNIGNNPFTEPPQAMPDDVKWDNSVQAYRNYYKVYKQKLASWKRRSIPEWYDDILIITNLSKSTE